MLFLEIDITADVYAPTSVEAEREAAITIDRGDLWRPPHVQLGLLMFEREKQQAREKSSRKAMIATYFQAVETHDMSALPTAANVPVTENGQEMKAGEGFFKSGGAVQPQRSLIDTERCGTVTKAVTNETVDGAQTLAVMAVRLKVEQGEVSEIETKCFLVS